MRSEKRQQQQHTLNKTHSCILCGQQFSRPCTLRQHLARLHGPGTKENVNNNNASVRLNKRQNIDQLTSKLWSMQTKNKVSCKFCSQKFDNRTELKQHFDKSHKQGRPETNTKCVYCDKNFARPWVLRRHINKVHQQPGPWKRISVQNNRNRFIQNSKPKSRDETAARARKNLSYLEIGSLPSDPVLCPNANQLKEWGYPEGALPEIAEYWDMIRTKHRTGKLLRQYNKRLECGRLDAKDIRDFILLVHKQQKTQYKLQIGWGCLLYSQVDNAFRYFWADNATKRFFPEPVFIANMQDVENQCEKIQSDDWIEHVTLSRPDTRWKLVMVTNVHIMVYCLAEKFPLLGCVDEELPGYILNHQAVVTLQKSGYSKKYEDNLCFFRALAYFRSGIKDVQANAKLLATEYQKFAQIAEPWDGGILMEEMLQLEQCFKPQINVYQLSDSKERDDLSEVDWKELNAEIVRSSPRSKKESPNGVINLDLCSNHLSAIRNIENYSRSWNCSRCKQPFSRRNDCIRHANTCNRNTESRAVYIGGAYSLPKPLWDRSVELGFDVPDSYRYCEYHSSFDFECISPEMSETPSDESKLRFERYMELVSCSVHCNYPGFTEPAHFRRYTTELDLIQRLMDYFDVIAGEHSRLMRQKLDELYKQILNNKADYERKIENNEDEGMVSHCKYMIKQLDQLVSSLDNYTNSAVFYAFNGSRFDFKVAKKFLVPETLRRELLIKGVIKRQGGYQMFKTESYVIKDAAALMPQGTSLRAFLQSQNVPIGKSHWPHDWFTSLEKLGETKLPPISAFADGLTGGKISITEEEYKELERAFNELPEQTMGAMLQYYNDRDVFGMVEAIEKLRLFWSQHKICIIQDCLSLSGLSSKLLQKDVKMRNFLWLPDKQNAFVWELAQKAVVGGPSIVWNRYHERNKTRIRDDQNGKLCRSIVGFDYCQLYLSTIGGNMPTGIPVHWKYDGNVDKFRRQRLTPKASSLIEIEYVMWRAHELGVEDRMRHKFNYGQTRLTLKNRKNNKFNFIPDGLLMKEQKAFNLHGCRWHYHDACSAGRTAIAKAFRNNEEAKVLSRKLSDQKASDFYASIGFEEEIMFECQWRLLRKRPEIKSFLDDVFTVPLSTVSCLSQDQLLYYIEKETLFGLCRVDIEVPEELYEKFEEMCPIFTNMLLDRRDLSTESLETANKFDIMKQPRRSLVGVMKAKNICLISDLVGWYLRQGLKVTRVYEVVQFKPKRIYQPFVDMISTKRAEALVDQSKKTEATMMKLAGNAAYDEKTLERKDIFTTTTFCEQFLAERKVKSNLFRDLEEIDQKTFEVTSAKRSFQQNTPKTLGVWILGLAKLALLKAYYEYFDRYFDRSDFELMEADTDSLYFAISSDNVDEFESKVKPHLRTEFEQNRDNYMIPKNVANMPGRLKVEYSGRAMICLAPKCYFVCNEDPNMGPLGSKNSQKGLQKRNNQYTKDDYFRALTAGEIIPGVNRGFMMRDQRMLRYELNRSGLISFYAKRRCYGMRTKPLLYREDAFLEDDNSDKL